jgi:secreted trypsin-like serine protease
MNGLRKYSRATHVLTLLVAVFLASIVSPARDASAVVGGSPTTIEAHPWQALVIVASDSRLCGGSIIDSQWIVTAAHCVVGASPDGLDVHVGTSTLRGRSAGNRAMVVEIVVHPDWDASAYRNDVALLRLAEPLAFGSSVAPIRVPVSQDPNAWPPVGTAATISGWGSTEFEGDPSNQLRAAQIQILGSPDRGDCGSYGSSFDGVVEICAGVPTGGIDACQGDSGSPLVVDVEGTPVLAGVTSVGFECGRVDYPGIFTRLTTFVLWMGGYVPSLSGPVDAPQQVQVAAIAGERLLVDWKAPVAAPLPVGYRVVTTPGSRSCVVDGSARVCVIEDVDAGRLYEVVVTAIYSSGSEASANPLAVVSVDGVTSVGTRLRPKRLAQWAGLKVTAKDDVWLEVRPASTEVCLRRGSKKEPRFVRGRTSGLCAVRVTVVRPSGSKKKSVAYVAVG